MLTLPPPSDLALLEQRTAHYAQAERALSTRRQYKVDWLRFERWATAVGLPFLPAAPATVGQHAAHLADAGYKIATIDQTLAAIGYVHRENGHDWYPGHPQIARVMRGIRRTLGSARRCKLAISGDLLEEMVGLLPPSGKGLQQRAALTVGWFGALRRSEIVAIDAADVRFTRDGRRDWIRLTLPRRKTDQEGRGFELALCEQPDRSACPVATLRAWMALGRITEGRVFAMKEETICAVVQRLMTRLGFDGRLYGAHSLRAGLITTAALHGRTLDAIMRQSGHRSPAQAMRYIRPATVQLGNVTEGILDGR